MGVSNSKCEVMVKPGQSGKTGEMQKSITEMDTAEPGRYVHFIIQANNRALVVQTGVRLDEPEESDDQVEDKVFTWYSGTKVKTTKSDLFRMIILHEVNKIICCAHPRRLEYLFDVIQDCEKAFVRERLNRRVCIWIDEADAYLSFWQRYQHVMESTIVARSMMITATPRRLFQEYKSLRVVPFRKPVPKVYVGSKGWEVTKVDGTDMGALAYLQMIVGVYEHLFVPGTRVFCPAADAVASHEAVAAWLYEMGWAVVILNGQVKEIRIPALGEKKARVVPIPAFGESPESAQEVGKHIARIYREEGLHEFCVGVTGNRCLNRGITFQNDGFLYDVAVMSEAFSDPSTAYQAACRCFGNLAGLENYQARAAAGKTPQFFTTEKVWGMVKKEEKIAFKIPRKSYKSGTPEVSLYDLRCVEDKDMRLKGVPIAIHVPKEVVEQIRDRNLRKRAGFQPENGRQIMELLRELRPDTAADLEARGFVHWKTNTYNRLAKSGEESANWLTNITQRFQEAKAGKVSECDVREVKVDLPAQNVWWAACGVVMNARGEEGRIIIMTYAGAK